MYKNLPDGLEQHQDVTLAIDIIYVNKIQFMIMMACTIHFGLAKRFKQKKSTIMTSVKQMIDTYNARVFKIRHILGVGQFKCLREILEGKGIILTSLHATNKSQKNKGTSVP